jgi:enterochelin esterase-like enzyme
VNGSYAKLNGVWDVISVENEPNLSLETDWTIQGDFLINSTTGIMNMKPVLLEKNSSKMWNKNYCISFNKNGLNHLFFEYKLENGNTIIMEIDNAGITYGNWYTFYFARSVEKNIVEARVYDQLGNLLDNTVRQIDGKGKVLTGNSDLYIGSGDFNSNEKCLQGGLDNIIISDTYSDELLSTSAIDLALINKKVNALNLHRKKFNQQAPFTLEIDTLSSSNFEAQKPANALSFDAGFVNANGKVFICEPTTSEQTKVFTDINQVALYYTCQSFLQYYYQSTEIPTWFNCGFAAYEADIRIDDAEIKNTYNSHWTTLSSFDNLNDANAFDTNDGFSIAYLFGEFMSVLKIWDYRMLDIVDENTIAPVAWWDIESTEQLFEIWMRYFNVRILEQNEQNRIKLSRETEHFKFYYRDADEFWAEYFSPVLEEAIVEYMDVYDFEVFEKFSYITMPECDFAAIGDRECINRYTGGTAWSSGLSTTSPNNEQDFDRFRRLIRHELGHLAQCHLPANNMTAWLNEGSAQFISHGPLSQIEIDQMQQQATETLANAFDYYGHLPTFEETKIYTSQSVVDYYLLGEYMLNFIFSISDYADVKAILMDHETGILNLGFSSLDNFMDAYYHYVNTVFLKIEEPDYFTNYDAFITKLTNLTSSADSSTQLNEFWDALIATGNFPFAIDTELAFLYRGSADKVNWAGDFNGWDMNVDAGIRIGVSDIWLLEKVFPADARCAYKIIKNGSEWLADPNNPYPVDREYGNSELRMPDYIIPPETIFRPGKPKGTLSDNILKFSTNLNYNSQYRVYTPAGYSSLSNLPTIYITDGHESIDDELGKMVIILDNLIDDQLIEPVIAVFLDPRDPDNLAYNRRGDEYRSNINFVNYVTQELIPEIDAAYKTNPSADVRAMMGNSYGGYNAAYFGVKASEYFHLIGINSAYLHPRNNYTIYADMETANLDNIKLYMSYGTFDEQGERYFNNLKTIFDQKGKEFEHSIVNDGHTWNNWSGIADDALEYFFPITNSTLLTLVTPSGGEFYVSGDSISIVWNSVSSSSIKIEYSIDNGSNWNEIIASTPDVSGSYAWIIPEETSNQCLVKISDVSDPSVFDVSENTFEIGLPNNLGGPYSADDNTVLLLHFEDNLINSSNLSGNGISHGSGISYSSSVNSSLGKCIKIDNGNASNEAYISIPHNENLNLSESWTIEAWYYLSSVGLNTAINPTIVSKATSEGNSNYLVWYHNSWGTMKGQFSNTNTEDIFVGIGNNTVTTGNWYHITYIRDDSKNQNKLIIHNDNWEIIAQEESQYDESQSTPILNDEDLLIGKLFSPYSFYFDGYIDELRISNVVRDFSEPHENIAPLVINIPDQTIEEGSSFASINLDNYVSDSDNLDNEITWSYSGNSALTVSIEEGIASLTPAVSDWTGSETITFTATDPEGASDSDAVTFTIEEETGIATNNNSFLIYPNPTAHNFHIEAPVRVDLSIVSVCGQQVVLKRNFRSGVFNASEFKKGVYLVVFTNEQQVVTKKLIIN